ncbi:MAG: hypothetical protein HY042_03925 [Spirochaetia bacterium]|nr:hypothetical protein [Spirochaetia bacterium]
MKLRQTWLTRIAAIGLAVWASCTNYSTQQQTVNPPILTGISVEAPGHIITLAAQNIEPGFTGYRVFTGTSDSAARSAVVTSGTDCFLATLPNQPIQYVAEIKPNQVTVTPSTSTTSTRLCAAPLQLVSGQYVAMRALIFRDFTSVDTSISSNTVIVP